MLRILMAVVVAQVAASPSPHLVVQRASRAVERDSASHAERIWSTALARAPEDRHAMLGLATLARLTFRAPRAESLYNRVIASGGNGPDLLDVVARVGYATLLTNGRTPARADSLLARARNDARELGLAREEAWVLVQLAARRTRTVGNRHALDLIAESRRLHGALSPYDEAVRSCLEGGIALRMGDLDAGRRLEEGRALARRSREMRVFAECTFTLAQINEHYGKFYLALVQLDTAIVWMRRTRSQYLLASAYQFRAFLRFQTGEFARSRRQYLESLSLARHTGNAAVESWALSGLANLSIVLGDFALGREYLTAAAAIHRARNDRWGYATARELEGELYNGLGDVAAARAAFTEASTLQNQMGQQLLAISSLRRLIRLELADGKLDAAERAVHRASEYAAAAHNENWPREVPYHLAGIAIERNQYPLADSLLRAAELRLKDLARPSADVIYNYALRTADLASRRGDWALTERSMERALASLNQWRNALADKDVRLRASQARRKLGVVGKEFPELIARLSSQGRVQSAFTFAEAVRARELANIAMQRAVLDIDSARLTKTIAGVKSSNPATLSAVQASLDDASALIAYVAGTGSSPTTVFVVTRRNVTAKLIAPLDSIAGTLERYLRLAADGADPSALASRLGNALLSDALGELPAGVSRLMIVPEQLLYRVPFDALRLQDGKFVVERFTIQVVPSAAFAVGAMRAGGRSSSGTLLAFGDPVSGTPRSPSAVAGGSAGSATSLPRLQYSGDEARRVASYSTGGRVLTRSAASENALRQVDLRNVRVLHFATHALMDDRNMSRSMLVLSRAPGSDGFVGPEELSALSLRDALVVLSGCSTIGGVVLGGEGLRGLTAPLLEAGARAVVATHWAIGDESILPFIDRFYSNMARGQDAATALQRAKLDAIRDQVPASVWAAFSIVGDGSMTVGLTPLRSGPIPWVRRSQGD